MNSMNPFFSSFQENLQAFFQDKGFLWNIAPLLALLVIVLVFVVWRIRHKGDKGKLVRLLKKMGEGVLIDIEVPDGVESTVHLDCVLLTRAGILVIDIKDYAGMIFGGESIDAWTQVLGSKSYKFDNPLFQNQVRVMVVKSLALGIPVFGRVVFTRAGEFPKGKPEGVSTFVTVKDDLNYINESNELSSAMLDGWEQIKRITH